MKASILLVEDDLNLGIVLSDQLQADGYLVTLCRDGADGFKMFNDKTFHLCILDIMLPKKDGFSLASDIRSVNNAIPILFLSAKSMTEDKIEGFRVGADDYMTKPFSVEELRVRVKALLRRVDLGVKEEGAKLLEIGSYSFDIHNYTLRNGSEVRSLTKKEAHVLRMLYQFKNEVTPKSIVLNAVWGQDDYFVGRSLDVFITKLRKYLKDDPTIKISNIHGIGFKLEF